MKDSLTYKANHYPMVMRIPNLLERILNVWEKSLVDYSEATCIKKAQRKTGLKDFGGPDFHEPLSILIKSCREEARLTFVGKMFVRTMILTTLINRLKIEKDIKDHPEILEHPIRKPLIVIGLPRTGTTLLHNLLSQDPKCRFLRCWEAMSPSPPPDQRTDGRDIRILKAKFLLAVKKFLSPEMSTVKPVAAKSAEECIILLGHSFLSHRAFTIFLNNPQYLNWLRKQDLTPAYQYYYRILQLLQWRYSSDHWVLKAPEHLINIDTLLNVFQDACLIQTHRNLLDSVPSSSSMMAIFRGAYSDFVDLESIGQSTLEWMSEAVTHAMQVRAKHDSKRFFDVQYRDLIHDPIGTVHEIYKYFGFPCSNEMDQRMHSWLNEHPRHKKAIHRYSLEQFALNEADIQQRFRKYYETYQVPIS